MPLQDTDFDQEFILAPASDTVGAAIETLAAKGGGDSWHILVARGDDLGIVQVGELREYLVRLGGTLFGLSFDQLGARIHASEQVQQEHVGIGTAERLARNTLGGVLAVMQGDKVAGRFYMPEVNRNRGPDPFPGSTMGQLYGDYIRASADPRSRWQPGGIEPPTCTHCGHQGFYRFRIEDESLCCKNCGKPISEED